MQITGPRLMRSIDTARKADSTTRVSLDSECIARLATKSSSAHLWGSPRTHLNNNLLHSIKRETFLRARSISRRSGISFTTMSMEKETILEKTCLNFTREDPILLKREGLKPEKVLPKRLLKSTKMSWLTRSNRMNRRKSIISSHSRIRRRLPFW